QSEPRRSRRLARGGDHLRRTSGALGHERRRQAPRWVQPGAVGERSQDSGRRQRRGDDRVREDPWPGAVRWRVRRHPRQRRRTHRAAARSEEHTSELQSLRHLVCRLLLEKKKKKKKKIY